MPGRTRWTGVVHASKSQYGPAHVTYYNSAVGFEIRDVGGDVPALATMTVTDVSSQSRRHVEWGLEGPQTYDDTTELIVDSDDMVTSGFSGFQATIAGGTDPNGTGNNAVGAVTYSTPQAIAGLGNLSHVGAFRVKGRIMTNVVTAQVRLVWQVGDGPMSANPWRDVLFVAGGFLATNWVEVDLGTVVIPNVVSGTQRWTGRIEATTSNGGEIDVDFLSLVPVTDGHGVARAAYSPRTGVVTGLDDFTGTTSGNNLSGRTATLGGTWATSGATTDFQFADALAGEQIARATTSDSGARFAILGSTNYTDTQVEAFVQRDSGLLAVSEITEHGVIARWVDSSNYLRGMFVATRTSSGYSFKLTLTQRVAGTDTVLASASALAVAPAVYYCLRLVVFASGRAILTILDQTKTTVFGIVEAQASALATSGALDDGKPGLYDRSTSVSTITRYYDDFAAATPTAEPIVIYSGRSMQIRHDDTIRDDSTGTYTGRVPSYKPAGRFVLPVGTSRAFVKARRNDVAVAADTNVTDATQVQVSYEPRGLAVPRS